MSWFTAQGRGERIICRVSPPHGGYPRRNRRSLTHAQSSAGGALRVVRCRKHQTEPGNWLSHWCVRRVTAVIRRSGNNQSCRKVLTNAPRRGPNARYAVFCRPAACVVDHGPQRVNLERRRRLAVFELIREEEKPTPDRNRLLAGKTCGFIWGWLSWERYSISLRPAHGVGPCLRKGLADHLVDIRGSRRHFICLRKGAEEFCPSLTVHLTSSITCSNEPSGCSMGFHRVSFVRLVKVASS